MTELFRRMTECCSGAGRGAVPENHLRLATVHSVEYRERERFLKTTPAIWHAWTRDSDGDPGAIVEYENGCVESVLASQIQFEDGPT